MIFDFGISRFQDLDRAGFSVFASACVRRSACGVSIENLKSKCGAHAASGLNACAFGYGSAIEHRKSKIKNSS
jgi:hypothetical protein